MFKSTSMGEDFYLQKNNLYLCIVLIYVYA